MIHVEYWEADDGTRFEDELDCRLYEINAKYTKNGFPFQSEAVFDGNFDDFYNSIDSFVVTNAAAFPEFAKEVYDVFGFLFPSQVKDGQRYVYDEDADPEIPWQMIDNTWLDEESLEKLSTQDEKRINHYLHGHCHEWVLDNYQEGDVAVVWNEWKDNQACLVHCYIKRDNSFMDVRGTTTAERLIHKGFECAYDHGFIHCKTLSEYKYWIRKILHTRAKKWQD